MSIFNIKGYEILIDDEDLERVRKNGPWRLHKGSQKQYFIHTGKRPEHENILLHRFITSAPKGHVVDHINGNTLDNRKINLRICSQAENQRNMKIKRTNTSGYKGVSYDEQKNKWRARITLRGKEVWLGYFDDPQAAHTAYCKASKKYHGEFGRAI